MATLCPAVIKLCAVRITLLDDDGTPLDVDNNYYVTNKTVSLEFTPVISEGQDREVRSGCDCIVANDKAPDILKRFTFAISQANLEPAFLAMILGQAPIENTDGDAFGVNWLADQLTCDGTASHVAFEGWSQAYNVDHPDEDLPWVHFRWPSTQWQLAANTLSAEFYQPALTGFSRGNGNFGDPYNDLPEDGTTVITSDFFTLWQTADAPPTAECGAQSLVLTP
jgi:hypothetical protein